MPINYVLYPHPELGFTVLAKNAQGICALSFGRSREALTTKLQKQFPKALLCEETALVTELIDILKTGRSKTPLDLTGTAFQQSVWQALLEIPLGQTRSYQDIANAINNPKAVRAVGSAIGANPVAWLVPCHRVISKDGSIGGFSCGLTVKKSLLAQEGIFI